MIRLSRRDPPSQPVNITVRELTGAALPLTLSLEASLGTLKQAVWARNGVEPLQQRLICKGQPLEDGTLSLHDCGVEAEGDVQLVVQSAEEAQERLREREAARKRAQVAEAVEQGRVELAGGFIARGLPVTGVNGRYQRRGNWDGLPLYRLQSAVPSRA